jgi:ParB family chromosome partitioning protein
VTVRRGGLGRGLEALIPSGARAVGAWAAPGARFIHVPLDAVRPNPRQPRTTLEDESLDELALSIGEVGLLQPVVVREAEPDGYELVMGERRWRAARRAGLTEIPAIVRDTPDDALLRDALLENLHREQLNPLEEAAAYAQLLEDFGATHEELAARIGRSRSQVTNTLRLLNLPAPVQRRVAAGVLSAGHARALLALDRAEDQERLAARIVAEGLSVRAVEEIVAAGEPGGRRAQGRAERPADTRPGIPGLDELAARLSDRFDTRVRVAVGRSKGKIVVEFASLEDLERILAAMAPDDRVPVPVGADVEGDVGGGGPVEAAGAAAGRTGAPGAYSS